MVSGMTDTLQIGNEGATMRHATGRLLGTLNDGYKLSACKEVSVPSVGYWERDLNVILGGSQTLQSL